MIILPLKWLQKMICGSMSKICQEAMSLCISEDLDEYTIRLASQMAAYFSKGKHSSSVPVNYTKIRTLKKPQGTKPGKVITLSLFNNLH